MIRALIDTGVWLRRYHRLPLKSSLKRFLEEEVHEFYLCPLSVAEVAFRWRRGRLPGIPDPSAWVEDSLVNFVMATPQKIECLRAGSWDWPHGDLVDRVLAAIAVERGLLLVHTDSVLKELKGFPQKYFPNARMDN